MNKELTQDHMASKWWNRNRKPVLILPYFSRDEELSLLSVEFFNEVRAIKGTELVLPVLLLKSKP